jgi:serine/threonine-protein kinase
VQQAEALFREGKQLIDAGKIVAACERFEASQRLDRALGTLLNLADCWQQAGRTASAHAAFLEAAEWAHKNGERKREGVARDRALDLAPSLARLTLAVENPAPGLAVRRNGTLIDAARFGQAVPIDPGSYTIEVAAPGHQAWKMRVQIPPKGAIVVDIPDLLPLSSTTSALVTPPPAPPPQEPPPPEPLPAEKPGIGPLAKGAIAAFVVAVVTIVVGSVAAAEASSTWSDVQNRCGPQLACDPTGVGWAGDAHTWADLSTATFVVAGAAAVTGIALLVASRRKSHEVTVAPAASAHGAGLSLSVGF